MNKRDNIIDSFNNREDKLLAAKIIDLVYQVEKYNEPRFTDFLDPASVHKVEKVLENFKVNHIVTSGISGCERNIVAIFPDFMTKDEVNIPILVVEVTCNSKMESISHRDVLGAILNLGIKREKIGDIIINDLKFYIFVYDEISDFILLNLNKIKHSPVKTAYINFDDIPEKEERFRVISSNVASLRLDAVLSLGFGDSRSRISREIANGNVKVNWEEVRELSFTVKQGDVISLKGKGRIIIDSIGGMTKKGRINLVIKRLL